MATFPSKRQAYAFAGAVLAGCISATVFEVGLNHTENFVVLVLYTTAIPLFLAGLGMGVLAGVLASAAGFLNLILRDPSNFAVLYMFVYALPAIGITALALRRRVGPGGEAAWLPEGYLLTTMALYPCAIFLIMAAFGSTHAGGLQALLQGYVTELSDAVAKSMGAAGTGNAARLFQFLSDYLPSIIGVSWMFVTTLSLLVAQKVLQQHKWNIRPNFTLREMHLPDWLIVTVAVAGLFGAFATPLYAYVGANLAIMLGLAFFFVGVAVVHAWANTKKGAGFILFAFYALLVCLPFFALVVALLGALDQWADFRQRLPKQSV